MILETFKKVDTRTERAHRKIDSIEDGMKILKSVVEQYTKKASSNTILVDIVNKMQVGQTRLHLLSEELCEGGVVMKQRLSVLENK